MGSFGGYYKGEKKKKKKEGAGKGSLAGLSAPVFKLPEIVSRKKQA